LIEDSVDRYWDQSVDRRGLGLGGGPPLYVLRLDPATRQVVSGRTAAWFAALSPWC